jgi:hypothetical protein
MDLSDASYYKFNERRNKGSQMGHTKKKFFRESIASNTEDFAIYLYENC